MTVVGVDIAPQPNYPFLFIQGDALEFVRKHGHEFDIIHASPPCQGYSRHVTSRSSRWVPTKGKDEPCLIAATRAALREVGKPYVIENVIGARPHMTPNLFLCGTMFGLPISRHRIFECSWSAIQPFHPKCRGSSKRFAEARGWEWRDMSVTGKGRHAGVAERWREIMGLDDSRSMSQREIVEAIPPAFTNFIGSDFLRQFNQQLTLNTGTPAK